MSYLEKPIAELAELVKQFDEMKRVREEQIKTEQEKQKIEDGNDED